MISKKSIRRKIAQIFCRYLPPIISPTFREVIYPRKIAKYDNSNLTVRSLSGSLYSGNLADRHFSSFAIHGYYYWRAWAIAQTVCTFGDTIIEVGANIGTETIGFSDIVGENGTVIAFEPLPDNFMALSNAIRASKYKNIRIHPFAIGENNSISYFSAPKSLEESGIGFVVESEQQIRSDLLEIRVVKLDTFLDREVLPQLIFIDVEGFEIKVLRGAREIILKSQPSLILEASPKLLKRNGYTINNLSSEIADLGYTPFGISRLGLVNLNEQNQISYSNWVCLPENKMDMFIRIDRMLKLCGLLPCFPGINPIVQKRK